MYDEHLEHRRRNKDSHQKDLGRFQRHLEDIWRFEGNCLEKGDGICSQKENHTRVL